MRRPAILSACASLALLATGGCYEFGHPFDQDHATEVRPGLDQGIILSWFGEPLSKTPLVGQKCTERWLWFYGRKGIGTASHSLAVKFDDKGKVCVP